MSRLRQADRIAVATTPHAVEVARRDRALGTSIEAIADTFRVSRRTVYRWLAGELVVTRVGDWQAPYLVDLSGPHRVGAWRRLRPPRSAGTTAVARPKTGPSTRVGE